MEESYKLPTSRSNYNNINENLPNVHQNRQGNERKGNNKISPKYLNNSKKYRESPYTKSNSLNRSLSFSKNSPCSSGSTTHFKSCITATCYLLNEQRFAVEFSSFFSPGIDIFKSIPSKFYDVKTKIWNFDVVHYDILIEKLLLLQPEISLNRLPFFVLKCLKLPEPLYSNVDLSSIDQTLISIMMPFQVDGVRFAIEKEGRCLIADDMGLGKTFQALAIALYYRKDWPLLIVTTSSMKNSWEQTIQEYLPSVSIMDIQYMICAKDYVGNCKILIVSHDMMTRSLTKLMERRFGVLIVDESHYLKNFKAKCTIAANKLGEIAKRTILLSGTPLLSRPNELYPQLAIINKNFFGNFFQYSKRYCDAIQGTFGWNSSGKSNLQELEVILKKIFMIRRTKDQVLTMLPGKRRQIISLDINFNKLSEGERQNLNDLANKYNNSNKKIQKHAALLSFFSETSKIKLPSVCSYILKVLEEEKQNKLIIFAHHIRMMDGIQSILTGKRVNFVRIDGNTSGDKRKCAVDQFQSDNKFTCALLSITAANAGITLTAAKLVIFAELHWNPSILSQAESRAHRIGQNEEVKVIYLLAPGTADDSIWPLLKDKQQTLKQVGFCKEELDDDITVIEQKSNNLVDISRYLLQSPSSNMNDLLEDEYNDILSKIDY